MAYLGRGLDKISNIEVLDNITFDGSSSYSITKGSVAFTPNSAQSLLISIDGVVQATNFTVSSSTIDFGVAIPSTSVCNFFLHYGTGVMTVPSDGSVTTAKLGDGAVTTAKINDGSVTSGKLASGVLPTNTPAFQAKLSSFQTVSNDTNTKVQLDTEIFDTDNCFDNSTNYRFTPNKAGKYMVYGSVRGSANTNLSNLEKVLTHIQKNGSIYENMYWRLDLRNNPGTQLSTSFSVVIDFNGSSDYIELFSNVDVTADTPGYQGSSTFMGAYRIGD